MALLLMILQIISAIPTIIKIVKEIIDLIRQLKPEEQRAARMELYGVVSGIKDGVVDPEHRHRLERLRDRLRGNPVP